MNENQSIEAARNGFEISFNDQQALYNKQTQDSIHLNTIIDNLNIHPGDRILDLELVRDMLPLK